MKLRQAKSAITGLTVALLLAVGSFANTALADHKSHRYSKQQHHQYYGKKFPHHNGNRSGWVIGKRHGNNTFQKRHFGRSNFGHSRHRGNRSFSSRQHRGFSKRHHRGFSHGRHHNQHRGHASYRSNDLVGALIGGAVIYHIGKELIRH